MENCKALVDSTGYTIVNSNDIIASDVPGGLPRTRRDFVGGAGTVTVQWTCSAHRYDYLQAFFRNTNNGADPFTIQLAFDGSALATYTAKMQPGTWGLTSQQGGTYVQGVTLWVVPNPPSSAADRITADDYSE